ncbi:hypothetical protein LUZ60_015011 [Juncus effusus]|nr:hypothetical protein LUZ60_015011 [Juncus effusus]
MEGESPIEGKETQNEENNNNNSDTFTENNYTPLEESKNKEDSETAINGEKNAQIEALFMEIEKNGETNLGEQETIDGEEEEEEGSDSFQMFLDDSENEQNNGLNDESITEVALTEEEVEELIQEFLDVETKAAEAQESLEKESLSQVEKEVRAELSESLEGEQLDLAVRKEMDAFIAQWEITLDELETRSSVLLEHLDGAGIELPSLYKHIEGQIADKCRTETWRKRVHWVGSQSTQEFDESVKDAEQFLQSCRPVRKKHGRLLEEGASGFLAGKLPINNSNGNSNENNESSWNSFNKFIQSKKGSESGFGSTNWASVYLASTPQQAASLGLNFPGVDEVEEIADIEGDDVEFKGINELELSEEQKRKYRKVREEDDENRTKRMQHHLKQERTRKKRLQPTFISDLSNGHFDASLENENGESSTKHINSPKRKLEKESDSESESKLSNKKLKKTEVITDSDDDLQVLDSNSVSKVKKKSVEVIDLDNFPTPVKNESKSGIECTLCSEILKNSSEVHCHPILEVAVCGSCKFALSEKIRLEGPDARGYCKWCGKSEDLINCQSCNMQFCGVCINRNLGEKCLSDAKSTTPAWQCCSCVPSLLENLISQCEKALRNPEISSSESGSDRSENENENENGSAVTNGKRRRKKRIRRIIDDAELAEETKKRIAEEKARQDHLKSMQESASKMSSKIFEKCSTSVSAPVIFEAVKEGYIINIAREIDEIAVRIPNSISVKLKPHQVAGIRFMWENVIQSVKKVKSGDKGLGCILAHTMGLGKTFQVIAFLYTVMRTVDLGLRSVLIVTPVNVLHNWKIEFKKWQPTELKPLRVYLLEDVTRVKRLYLLSKWRAKGGILLMGYVSFRNLSQGKGIKDRNIAMEIANILHNAADVLVCDEAHLIKNRMAETTQALKQVRTQRRIALTGSPLQNNLMEYYCMVDFVREGYLGSSHEFRNRFQNPIENGQHANSTADDVKVMNQRSHILYEQLKGFVQRMDMNVVKKDLPPKTVFVITVKLSPLQRRLYKRFLDVHGFSGNTSSDRKVSCFFAGYATLAQVWNHPGLLQMGKENKISKKDIGETFLDDDSSSDDNLESYLLAGADKQKMKNDLKRNDEVVEEKWWESLLEEKTYQEVDLSGKMVLLLDILSMSSEFGEKSLIFSQSIPTIDLIELYLSKMRRKGTEDKFWKQSKDWYRIDGTTPALERQNLVEKFNDPSNKRVKCCVISTRAGSLGINLHAANRVILVDGSWNPTYDLQAIYRAWRYGQKKPVYAYRLLAHGTMEEKIYKRQVTKEGLAARVVDRQQVYRTMSKEEIKHLFDFGDEELLDQNKDLAASLKNDNSKDVGPSKEKHKSTMPAQEAGSCSDVIMNNLLSLHQPSWIANYHEHETLLQENEAERLTKEEQEMAWLNYQRSLVWEEEQRATYVEEQNADRKVTINTNNNNSNNNVLKLESTVHQVQQAVKSSTSHSHQNRNQNKGASTSSNPKSRAVNQRKCSNLAHLLTLRSVGAKAGSSTTCADCSQEISWETLNRDGRTR